MAKAHPDFYSLVS